MLPVKGCCLGDTHTHFPYRRFHSTSPTFHGFSRCLTVYTVLEFPTFPTNTFHAAFPNQSRHKKLCVIDHTAAICINCFQNLLAKCNSLVSQACALAQNPRWKFPIQQTRTKGKSSQNHLQVTRDVFEAALLETWQKANEKYDTRCLWHVWS